MTDGRGRYQTRGNGVKDGARLGSLLLLGVVFLFSSGRGVRAEGGPELVLQLGHSSGVNAVAFSPVGQTLASGSSDSTIKLWNARTGDLEHTLLGHAASVTSVVFSPDGQLVASGSEDKTVKLWNARTGELERTLQGHTESVNSVAFSPDGEALASGGENIRLWNARTGAPQRVLQGHAYEVHAVAFSPDGETLATGSRDSTIKLWNVRTGALEHTLQGHAYEVNAVAFSPDGRTVASGSDDATARLWNARTGAPETTIHVAPGDDVKALAFSPDGETLAGGCKLFQSGGAPPGQAIHLWNARTGELERAPDAHAEEVSAVAFSPDGQALASASSEDRSIKLWNIRTRDLSHTFRGREGSVTSAAFAPDGQALAVGNLDKTIRLWNPRTGELERTLQNDDAPVHAVAVSRDGRTLASGGPGGSVRLWNVVTGKLDRTLESTATRVDTVAFSPDGQTMASSGGWDWAVTLRNQRTGELERTLQGHENDVTSIAFSPDSQTLASGSVDKTIKLWNTHTGQIEHTLQGHTEPVDAVAFSPDGKTVASGSADQTIKLWNAQTGEFERDLKAHTDRVDAVSFSPDGQILASGSADNSIKLWNVRTWELERTIQCHTGDVRSVIFSPDGHALATSGDDGTIKLWSAQTGSLLATFVSLSPEDEAGGWVSLTPHGYYASSPGAARFIKWRVDEQIYPASAFRSTFERPDVVAGTLDLGSEELGLKRVDEEAGRKTRVVPVEEVRPPIVRILSPTDGAAVSAAAVTVRVRVETPSGEPVTSVKALVDGRPVETQRDLRLVATEGTDREIQVAMPPHDCTVSVMAGNRFGWSEPAFVRVRWQGGTAPDFTIKPKLYILAVGISQYPHPDWVLQFPAKDATDFAAAMKAQKGKLYSDVAVRLLVDGDATKDNILDGLEWIQKQTTQHDVAAVFLSGHGVNDTSGSYYFVPVNFNLDHMKSTGVGFSDIKSTVESLAGKTLVFVDSCHSGNVMGSERDRALDLTSVIDDLISAENGAVVFAASTGKQTALERAEWGNGAFTKALVEGLSGKADYQHKGTITVNMLDLYISERVKELTGGRQTPTTTKPTTVPDFPVAVVE